MLLVLSLTFSPHGLTSLHLAEPIMAPLHYMNTLLPPPAATWHFPLTLKLPEGRGIAVLSFLVTCRD